MGAEEPEGAPGEAASGEEQARAPAAGTGAPADAAATAAAAGPAAPGEAPPAEDGTAPAPPGEAPPAEPAPPPDTTAESAAAAAPRPKLADESHGVLGPEVRTPVGIPKQYRPTDLSIHQLLQIELTDFVGPLDLLLFLIREHDLDILDIPIAFITERYLVLLDTLADLPIDVAAEFLVMAAELTHIKSKMLLPPDEGVPVEMEEGAESGGDPRADLVRRLLEYQKYRDAARQLDSSSQLGRDVFARGQVVPEAMEDLEPGPGDFSIFRLVEAMADVLSRLTPEKQHEVIADTVTITERIELILAFGEARGLRFPFVDLFAGMESRRVVVMTFLALLEMARTGMLKIEQDEGAEEAEVGALGPGGEVGAEAEGRAPPSDAQADTGEIGGEAPGAPRDAVAAPEPSSAEGPAPSSAEGPEPVRAGASAAAEPTEAAAAAGLAEPAPSPVLAASGSASPVVDPDAAARATEPPEAAIAPTRVTAADVEAAYEEAERGFDEPRVRTIRAVSELPPLRVPRPGVLMLVLTGTRATLGEGSGGGVRDDYAG